MRKLFYTLSVLFVFSLVLAGCSKNSVEQKFLELQAKALNTQCPMDIGQGITLTKAEVLPGKVFVYNYSVKNVDPTLLNDTVALKNNVKPTVIQSLKATPEMKEFSDKGVTIIYRYLDTSGKQLYQLDIAPEEYKQ